MKNRAAKELIDKCLEAQSTANEQAILETWYNQLAEQQKDIPSINYPLRYKQLLSALPKETEAIKINILLPSWFMKTIATAAAVFTILLGIWLFKTFKSARHTKFSSDSFAKLNIRPGKNKATLTLSNGTTIPLNDTKAGLIVDQNKLKYNDGTDIKVEKPSQLEDNKSVNQLTASTPRGGTYQITLPDGSKVWLNAASSIKFPSSFKGEKQRAVTLEGEAYFEIAKNKLQPFIVKSDAQQVEVLGTHFNINSYPDEGNIRTTLLEGSVKVSTPSKAITYLKPGQQSIFKDNIIQVKPANLEKEMAWKQGYFRFDDTDIQTIMRTVSRWYDIDIVYQGKLPTTQFFGSISRYKSIDQILNMLESTGKVHFKLEERRIVVTP